MNNETHLSAEQEKTPDSLRVPQAHEDKRRPQNHQPQKKIRQSRADNSLSFPKSARILSKRQFQTLQRSNCRWTGDLLLINYRRGESGSPKLGLTVSRKYGKAHMRNRFKRVVREAFRHTLSQFPKGLELNILPRKKYSENILTSHILLELEKLLCSLR